MFSLVSALAFSQVDPNAPCASGPDVLVKNQNNSCCYTNHTPPVLGGVDFVDLLKQQAPFTAPLFGTRAFTAMLNGYAFYFVSEANRDAFNDNPWAWAPRYGGF